MAFRVFTFFFMCCCFSRKLRFASLSVSQQLVLFYSTFQPLLKKSAKVLSWIGCESAFSISGSLWWGLKAFRAISAHVESCDGWIGHRQSISPGGHQLQNSWLYSSPSQTHTCLNLLVSWPHYLETCRRRVGVMKREKERREREKDWKTPPNIWQINSSGHATPLLLPVSSSVMQPVNAGVCVCVRACNVASSCFSLHSEPDLQTTVWFSLSSTRDSRLNSGNLSPCRHVFPVGRLPSNAWERVDSQLTSLRWLVCHPHHLLPRGGLSGFVHSSSEKSNLVDKCLNELPKSSLASSNVSIWKKGPLELF